MNCARRFAALVVLLVSAASCVPAPMRHRALGYGPSSSPFVLAFKRGQPLTILVNNTSKMTMEVTSAELKVGPRPECAFKLTAPLLVDPASIATATLADSEGVTTCLPPALAAARRSYLLVPMPPTRDSIRDGVDQIAELSIVTKLPTIDVPPVNSSWVFRAEDQ